MLKRTSKDSLFCHLFSQDEYLLELYRALRPEDDLVTIDDLDIVTIEHVITNGVYNDLGFTARNRLVVLIEAQSTWSYNIITRLLMYLIETYRRYIEKCNLSLHDSATVKLPEPELYVVYTGNRDIPETVTFAEHIIGVAECAVDAKVRVLKNPGRDIIGQYISCTRFIDEIRQSNAPADRKARLVCQYRAIMSAPAAPSSPCEGA